MAKLKEWIVIISMIVISIKFQLISSGEVDQYTMQERMDSVEAVLELHGIKIEQIQTETRGLKEKVNHLEIKDTDILGDLTKLNQKVAQLGVSVSSLNPIKDRGNELQLKVKKLKTRKEIETITIDNLNNAARETNTDREAGGASNEMIHHQNQKNTFKGMPASCKDLQILGHKLNGFYSIKKSQPKPKQEIAKIETVFCNFQSTSDAKGEGFETRIGIVDVKSSQVQFSVEIKELEHGYYNRNKDEKIEFRKQVLNIGGGYDLVNQWFRAPYPGTYFFSISGSKLAAPNRHRNTIDKLDIGFMVNGKEIGEALSSENTLFGSLSFQISLKLNAGDKVELVLYNGEAGFLYFTGWMLDEDLHI